MSSPIAAREADVQRLRAMLMKAQQFADTMPGWSDARALSREIHVVLGCEEDDCPTCTLHTWGTDRDA